MARIVIAPHAGGIGDNLVYSTLPELFTERGDDVWVNNVNPPARNAEAYELIWGRNPHVAGFTADPPNAGVHTIVNEFIWQAKRWRSPVAAVEHLHGFTPRNRNPKIYYTPNYREDVANRVLFSPRSISAQYGIAALAEFCYEVSRWHGHDFRDVAIIESQFDGPHGSGLLPSNPRITVRDIFEKVDLIFSCRAFLSTESGDQSIAAAVRPPDRETHVICTNWHFNDKIFVWDGPIYRVTRDFPHGGDYHPYGDANRPVGHWGEVAIQ